MTIKRRLYENVEEFTWDYRATISDSSCTPLGNISDSI